MQPRRPQGQLGAADLRRPCGRSRPAAPRPSQRLPSRISPPPTPVPQKTPSIESYGLPGAELELGVGGDVDVVADPHRRAERVRRASGRAGSCPPSRAGCGPRRRRRSSRRCRPASRPRSRRANRSAPRRRPPPRRAPRPSAGDVLGAALRRRRAARLADDLAGRAHDRRLDLGPAEVDSPAERVLSGGGRHRGESIPSARRSASARARAAAVPAPRPPHAAGAERRAHHRTDGWSGWARRSSAPHAASLIKGDRTARRSGRRSRPRSSAAPTARGRARRRAGSSARRGRRARRARDGRRAQRRRLQVQLLGERRPVGPRPLERGRQGPDLRARDAPAQLVDRLAQRLAALDLGDGARRARPPAGRSCRRRSRRDPSPGRARRRHRRRACRARRAARRRTARAAAAPRARAARRARGSRRQRSRARPGSRAGREPPAAATRDQGADAGAGELRRDHRPRLEPAGRAPRARSAREPAAARRARPATRPGPPTRRPAPTSPPRAAARRATAGELPGGAEGEQHGDRRRARPWSCASPPGSAAGSPRSRRAEAPRPRRAASAAAGLASRPPTNPGEAARRAAPRPPASRPRAGR